MKFFVPQEPASESRTAISPDAVKRLAGLGIETVVESGAGLAAGMPDAVLADAGATIAGAAAAARAEADIVAVVRPPEPEALAGMKPGALLVGLLSPYADHARLQAYAEAGVTAFAFEFIPRISRAQGMDALSSQANLAGYAAVLQAAARFGRGFPMMVTAAGTVAPARVLVLGAGVAGLQAIATARRLGAVVSAMDVRPAAKEQVESLGATFVDVTTMETRSAETQGGYAREMSSDYRVRQAEKLMEVLPRTDIVITTALIPGRPAPLLLSTEMVETMRAGSIVVDMAVEQGGNVQPSVAGETVNHKGVLIVGDPNLPGRVATDASALYARNIVNFLTPLVDKDAGALKIDWEDEIVSSALICRDGAITNPVLLEKKE
ncbi:MAG: Re/Si-specific NAD(P)(+) transhydrogenase subunit alpha [Alphaproteobacteria bacterium]|nr:Re/Si-specific NAD(P)(+) transhydrogenase subunit alpha [Alphaproteobacteria bacterium]MCB9928185.1 Re/Si-specific NAD(P)(+) transhydrogenase subunit alpha [Alphaproteobacteria bacterium]